MGIVLKHFLMYNYCVFNKILNFLMELYRIQFYRSNFFEPLKKGSKSISKQGKNKQRENEKKNVKKTDIFWYTVKYHESKHRSQVANRPQVQTKIEWKLRKGWDTKSNNER